MRSKLQLLATIAICLIIIYLYATKNLRLYIHPRYELFTLILVSFGLVMHLISYFSRKYQDQGVWGWLVVAIAICSVFIPAASLSDVLAAGRLSSGQDVVEQRQSALDTFSNDLTRFDVRDWHVFLGSSPKPEAVVGKEAHVEGFLFRSNNQLYVARYQITCCAVDATPLTLPLQQSETSEELIDGDWVRLTGVMERADDEKHPYQLAITSLEIIEEPDQPYVY